MTANGSYFPCRYCGAQNSIRRTHCGTCRKRL